MKEKEIITYQTKNGKISFDVNVFEETVWLTQKQIADLFCIDQSVVSRHIVKIFQDGEIIDKRNMQKMHIPFSDKPISLYSLDVILAVGYRTNSKVAIEFRKWATLILKQYLINGYAINEPRIRKIESSLDELVASHKLLKEDVDGIKNLLVRLIERPIVIQNHNRINIGSSKLEAQIIELLNELAKSLKNKNSVKKQIEELKHDAKKVTSDNNARSRLLLFLQEMGDENSKLRKVIKGAGITKKLIAELLKLSAKIKNLT